MPFATIEKNIFNNEATRDGAIPVLEKFSALKWYPQLADWIRDPYGSDNVCFNYPLALRLEGRVDKEALRRGLEAIVSRHQVFRSIFYMEGQDIIQNVLEPHNFFIAEINLGFISEDEKQSEILRLAVQDAQHPFDLTREPLLRATLVSYGADECILLLTTHHFACDDWSTDILLGELSQLYSAFSQDRPAVLPDITYQYSDFVQQYRHEAQGEESESRLQYWKQQFAGSGDFYYLTPDYPRSEKAKFHGKRMDISFSAELDEAIKTFSRANGLSPFMMFSVGFMCLFGRYSSNEDVGIGICVANRNQVEVEEIVGPFSNRLLLRANIAATLTIQEVLEQVRDAAWEVYSNQDVPCGELVENIASAKRLRRNRLFQALIVLENAPKHAWKFSGLNVSRFSFDTGTSCYDLHIWLKNQDGLQITIQYDDELFAPETIQQIVRDYELILTTMIESPQSLVKDIPIFPLSRTNPVVQDEAATFAHI